MKRMILIAVGLLAVPANGDAQTDAQTIERALAAAPSRARDGATVVKWNADFTWVTVKQGTNQTVCYDRSGEPRRAVFDVQCTSLANLERVAQNRRFEAEGSDRQAVSALITAAEAAGTRVKVEYGSVWIAMRGDDQASAGKHTTIAVPGATTASTGLPENGRAGGAWIMGAGTAGAHIMTPGS